MKAPILHVHLSRGKGSALTESYIDSRGDRMMESKAHPIQAATLVVMYAVLWFAVAWLLS